MTNLLSLQQSLLSKNESEPIFSCSTEKFMFWCLGDIYLGNEWADSCDSKSTKYHQHTVAARLVITMAYIPTELFINSNKSL